MEVSFYLILRYEDCFIITGLALPSPSAERTDRQEGLLKAVRTVVSKLDASLPVDDIKYVKVVKGPAPSILEVECKEVKR
jgi:hypothetical protein